MPLARNDIQSSNPLTWHFNPGSSQGSFNVELGNSSAPQVEEDILSAVASYGKQLGRIEEALAVLLDHFRPETPLAPSEQNAIAELRTLLGEIAEAKACSFAKTRMHRFG
jgi:hypothetical protein